LNGPVVSYFDAISVFLLLLHPSSIFAARNMWL